MCCADIYWQVRLSRNFSFVISSICHCDSCWLSWFMDLQVTNQLQESASTSALCRWSMVFVYTPSPSHATQRQQVKSRNRVLPVNEMLLEHQLEPSFGNPRKNPKAFLGCNAHHHWSNAACRNYQCHKHCFGILRGPWLLCHKQHVTLTLLRVICGVGQCCIGMRMVAFHGNANTLTLHLTRFWSPQQSVGNVGAESFLLCDETIYHAMTQS